MTELLASLGTSAFSTWLRESPSIWAYPTILTLHTAGLGVLVGANWMVDLRVLGFARAIPLSILSRAFPIMWAGFWVNAISGVLLFIADPSKGTTTVFMWKLALIAAGVALIIALKRRLYGRLSGADRPTWGVRVMAGASLLLWVAAIGAGRWMAYVTSEVLL
jgi:hypothetical protein